MGIARGSFRASSEGERESSLCSLRRAFEVVPHTARAVARGSRYAVCLCVCGFFLRAAALVDCVAVYRDWMEFAMRN